MSDQKEDHTSMALEEALAWENYDGPKIPGGIGPALSARFGRSHKSIRLRHQLFRAGSAASPLWTRVEKGMSLYTAVRILQKATSSFHRSNPDWKPGDGLQGEKVRAFVDAELAAYDAAPWQELESPGGGTFKRRKGERKPPQPFVPAPDPGPVPRPIPPIPGQAPSAEADPAAQEDLPASQWARIKAALEDLLDDKASGLEPGEREQVRLEFDIEVRRSMTWLRSRMSAASKAAKGLPLSVVRRDVVRWCSVLHIDPPRGGKPVDPELLRKQFRAMSKAYHPDKNPGVAEMAEKMKDVSLAYHGLLDYNNSREKD